MKNTALCLASFLVLLAAVAAVLVGSGSSATATSAVVTPADCTPAEQQYGDCGSIPTGEISVSGSLILDAVGNSLSIEAKWAPGADAIGHAVLTNGCVPGDPDTPAEQQYGDCAAGFEVTQIRITCLIPLSASTVIVGGVAESSTSGLESVHPFYSFVLEDRGAGLPDKYTLFYQVSGVCVEAFGPAVETAAGGDIVITSY